MSKVMLVLASTPDSCDVCQGDQAVLIRDLGAVEADLMPCPHCIDGLPLFLPPMLEDRPVVISISDRARGHDRSVRTDG